MLGFDAVVGNLASPYSAGSAYVLLHHVFGEVNGKRGRVGTRDRRHGRDHAGDGAGRRRRTACASMSAPRCAKCIIEGGRAAGVVLKDGTAVRARAVIANVNPQMLFQALVPRDAVPACDGQSA